MNNDGNNTGTIIVGIIIVLIIIIGGYYLFANRGTSPSVTAPVGTGNVPQTVTPSGGGTGTGY